MYKKTITFEQSDIDFIVEVNAKFTDNKHDWLQNPRRMKDEVYWKLRKIYEKAISKLQFGWFDNDPFTQETLDAQGKRYNKSICGKAFMYSYVLNWMATFPETIDEDFLYNCLRSRPAYQKVVHAIYEKVK